MHSPSHQGPPTLGTLCALQYRNRYPAAPASVATARHDFMCASKRSLIPNTIAEPALLGLSELVTNAAIHAKVTSPLASVHVACSVRGMNRRYLRVAVQDLDANNIPELLADREEAKARLDAMEWDISGRGLLTIASFADHCGVEHGEYFHGKIVWFEMYLYDVDRRFGGPTTQARAAAPFSAPVSPWA